MSPQVLRVLLPIAIVVAIGVPRRSEACASAYTQDYLSRRVPSEDELIAELPYRTTEQLLVMFDRAAKREHLVVEMRFDQASESFAVLIPVPSVPVVTKVEKSPFSSLAEVFPFAGPSGGLGLGRLVGGGQGAGVSALDVAEPMPAVEILEESRVGRFAATVVKVNRPSEFAKFLVDQKLVVPKATEAWAERYARLGFPLVALRYERSEQDSGRRAAMTSEVIRLSFDTPEPFLPYAEPKQAARAGKRLIAGWYVGAERVRPITHRRANDAERLVTPLREGIRYRAKAKELRTLLAGVADAVPDEGDFVVQTFRDWKVDRAGFGDVVFVSEKARTFEGDEREARRKLLGLVDPTLLPALPSPPAPANLSASAPAPAPSSSAAPLAPAPASGSCSASTESRSAPPAIALAVAALMLGLVRKRRSYGRTHNAVSLLVCSTLGCARSEPSPVGAAVDASANVTAPASTSAVLAPVDASPAIDMAQAVDASAREESALRVLGGALPEGGLELLAGTAPEPPAPRPRTVPIIRVIVTKSVSPDAKDILRRRFLQRLPRYRYCYERGLQINPELKGRFELELRFGQEGTVTSVNPVNVAMDSATVGCIAASVRVIEVPQDVTPPITMATVSFDLSVPR